jgi:thiol-disulfide isomerase/thioredoxin
MESQSMAAPNLLERDHSSISVVWVTKLDSKKYELEISENGIWRSLSNSIATTTIRKKNLEQGFEYCFRVRSQDPVTASWSAFSNPSEPMSVLSHTIKILDPPTLLSKDSQSVTIKWIGNNNHEEGYNLRFRAETDQSWQVINSVIRDNVVRKKGLKAGVNYYFSVCPVGHLDQYDYSASSLPFSVATVSQYLTNLLPTYLHTSKWPTKISTSEALAGKVVAIYFSAHWCGPCRSFTPKLSAAYNLSKSANKNFEIIFCSADHNETDFESYYKEMPFLAIPYDDDKRESFMGIFKVSGIPRLVVLSPSGRIIVENAAGENLSLATIDSWIEKGSKM